MGKNLYTFTYDKEHREFAGIYSLYDFNTTYPNPDRFIPYTRTELENHKRIQQRENKTQERQG